jgi:hypothetical protein
MSRRICRDWLGMISALEASAGIEQVELCGGGPADDLELSKRAALALECLRLSQGRPTADCVRQASLRRPVSRQPRPTPWQRCTGRSSSPQTTTTSM